MYPEEARIFIGRFLLYHTPEDLRETSVIEKAQFIFENFIGKGKANYGFRSNLLTGNYTPLPQEFREKGIRAANCTTIIPVCSLPLTGLGVRHEIWSFEDVQDIQSPTDENTPPSFNHYAIVLGKECDPKGEHPYILDPYCQILGPILEVQANAIIIGDEDKKPLVERRFSRKKVYTEEEFSSVFDHLRSPQGNLEMLTAGQKFAKGKVKADKGEVMIYYNQEERELTTRAYIERVGLQDLVIYCRNQVNEEGRITRRHFELLTAQGFGWNNEVDPQLFGICSETLLNHFKTAWEIKEEETIHLISKAIYNNLFPSQQAAIRRQVLARTLYENKEERFHFPGEARERILREILRRKWAEQSALQQDQRKSLGQRVATIQATKEARTWLTLKKYWEEEFHKTADKILFAQSLRTKNLKEEVQKKGLDPRSGYTAMLGDVVPYLHTFQEELTNKTILREVGFKIWLAERHKEYKKRFPNQA